VEAYPTCDRGPRAGDIGFQPGKCSARLRNLSVSAPLNRRQKEEETIMDGIVYLVGLIVIIMFVLSLFGLR
jgi:hypothetical protein